MLSLDAAFDRIGTTLLQLGYKAKEKTPPDSSGNQVAIFSAPDDMAVRVCSYGRARLLTIQVEADGEWIDFAKRGVGPEGLQEAAVEALVHSLRNEVDETSTDGG